MLYYLLDILRQDGAQPLRPVSLRAVLAVASAVLPRRHGIILIPQASASLAGLVSHLLDLTAGIVLPAGPIVARESGACRQVCATGFRLADETALLA